MKPNTKFILWILGAFLFAFIAGRFVTPGPVPAPKPVHAPGRAAAVYVQPIKPSQTSEKDISNIPTISAAPAITSGSPSGAAFVQAPVNRGQQTPTTSDLTISELYQLIESNPKSIANVSFINSENIVRVERVNQLPSLVKVSDVGGKQALLAKLDKSKISFQTVEPKVDPIAKLISENFGTILVLLVIVGFLIYSSRRAAKQMGSITGMGKSRSKDVEKLKDSIAKVTFKDVAGCEEAVKELRRVVKGLVGANVYKEFGAELPKGILLIGPPGTGKTLLAKAVAHETGGSFEVTSGSAFVEMLVGVGASRVRDLFESARKKVAESKKPHIIFIDEIDAVGGKRGGGTGSGSNSEREQTLNQILVEMDGVIGNQGIIIIAATNRVDMLDDALLRPGRFDCHVSVDLPDRAGREAIFAIHIGERLIASDVTLAGLAHRTYGYSGAEIKGVCNRAFILAAERYAGRREALVQSGMSAEQVAAELVKETTMVDFDEGVDFVRYGNPDVAKQGRMKIIDKKNTAYHEAGHADTAVISPDADPVVKITIMRRSKALGYVQTMPDTDRVSITRQQALSRIVMAMAGRAAQEVFLNTVDAGASNDFQQAADMAKRMVTAWGMSRLGPISVGERGEGPFGGGGGHAGFGQDLGNEIDREIRYITSTCYKAAKKIVEANRERIEALVAILMHKETVLADEWQALLKAYPSKIKWEDLTLPEAEFTEEGGK
ncbi:ATP-dependent zinc metalloprotease FtsH [soil metagenome]